MRWGQRPDEWHFEWPEDISDAPETTDTTPELPWTPEIPTLALDDTTVSDGNFEWLQDTTDGDSVEWDFKWPEDIADAPEIADTAPEPPQTPKQPSIAVSHVTPSTDTARELLDTRIVP